VETLNNAGIKLVCVDCIERALDVSDLLLFFCHFTLCSSTVNASQVLFSNGMKELQNEGLSDFQKGQMVFTRLAGASVNKIVTLLGACRAAGLKVMTAYTSNGKISSAKKNSGRKTKLSEEIAVY
jgi:hypothetical protein